MQEIVKKINDKLRPSGWYDQLRIFLESSDFSDIIVELKRKVEQEHQRFCPGLSSSFRFLEDLAYADIKAVILIDYACNKLEQADGVALSTLDKYIERTPVHIFQSINETKFKYDVNGWLKQGMLIVPLSLTSKIEGKSHKKLWAPFIVRVIEAINKKYIKIPWVLIGPDTLQYEEDIVSPYIRTVELKNPMDDTQWHRWLNDVLKAQKKAPISW